MLIKAPLSFGMELFVRFVFVGQKFGSFFFKHKDDVGSNVLSMFIYPQLAINRILFIDGVKEMSLSKLLM